MIDNENSSAKPDSFVDELIDRRIGLGKFQFVTLSILVLVDFNDGAQIVLMSFIIPILKTEWNLSSTQTQVLTSSFFLGMAIGSFITGKLADLKGRRIAIIFSSLLLFLISTLFYFIDSIFWMTLARFVYGICYGFSIPLTTSMTSEITPMKYRGRFLVIINFFVSVGKIFGCLLAVIFLKDFQHGNWKMMMVASGIPSLIVFVGGMLRLRESPRFLLASARYEEAFAVFNEMISVNSRGDLLTEDEKHLLIKQAESSY